MLTRVSLDFVQRIERLGRVGHGVQFGATTFTLGQTDDDWRSGLVLPLHGPFPVDDDGIRAGTVRSQCRLERHLLVLWDRTRKYRDMSDAVAEVCSLLFSPRRGGEGWWKECVWGGGGERK